MAHKFQVPLFSVKQFRLFTPQFVAQIEQSVLEGGDSEVDVGSGHGGGGAVHQPCRRGNAAHQHAEMDTSRHAAGPSAGGEAQACITNRFVGEVDIAQTTKTDGLAADASVLEGLIEALAQEFTQAVDVGTLLRVEALHSRQPGRHAYRIAAECAGVHHRPRLVRVEALHQVPPAADGADGQAAADDLTHGGQVRCDAIAVAARPDHPTAG